MDYRKGIKRIVQFDDFTAQYHEDLFFGNVEGHIRIMCGSTKIVEASVPQCANDDEIIEASKQLLALYLSLMG